MQGNHHQLADLLFARIPLPIRNQPVRAHSAITPGCLLSVHVLLPEPSRLDLLLALPLNT
jgi:hypothetical protein